MKSDIFYQEIRNHFRRHGRYAWVFVTILSFGLLLFSKIPKVDPVFYSTFIVIQGGFAILNTWLCRLHREWNPDTLWLWEKMHFGSQVSFFGLSSVLASWVFWQEGAFSSAGLIALAMIMGSIGQVSTIFYPVPFYRLAANAIVLGPVVAVLALSKNLQDTQLSALAGLLFLYVMSLELRVRLQKKELLQRIHLEKSVHANNAMMQKILDVIPVKLSWLDKKFKYKMANKSLTQYLGIAPRSLIGSEFGFRQDPEFKALNRRLKTFRESNQAEYAFEHAVKVGEESRRHHIILKKIETFEGTEIVVISVDIEDIKKAQEILNKESA